MRKPDPKVKAAIYRYIRIFEIRNGFCPSTREIKSADVGVSSISTIARYINDLVSEGKLQRPNGQCRVALPKKTDAGAQIPPY